MVMEIRVKNNDQHSCRKKKQCRQDTKSLYELFTFFFAHVL